MIASDQLQDTDRQRPPWRSKTEFEFTMAFQPIVDYQHGAVISYEALARGPNGEPAPTVFSQVPPELAREFDAACRSRAMQLAVQLGMPTCININFRPNSIDEAGLGIAHTIFAAQRAEFPVEHIVFEFVESEQIADPAGFAQTVHELQSLGFRTAIDDFGTGYSGLSLLAELRPDFVKIDLGLIRDIDSDRVRRVIVEGIIATCQRLSIDVIAEGVETPSELKTLVDRGVNYFQGYLFARPGLERLPEVHWPVHDNWSSTVVDGWRLDDTKVETPASFA